MPINENYVYGGFIKTTSREYSLSYIVHIKLVSYYFLIFLYKQQHFFYLNKYKFLLNQIDKSKT